MPIFISQIGIQTKQRNRLAIGECVQSLGGCETRTIGNTERRISEDFKMSNYRRMLAFK